jgi:Zn-dependent peptidase ImmA (M78 family)
MNGIVRENTHRPLSIDEFRAFTIVDEYAPLIFINAADSPDGRLFSLLHEFAHVCLGRDNLFNDLHPGRSADSIETLCNAASAEILVPSSFCPFVRDEHSTSNLSIPTIVGRVASTFKCSQVVIARRAFDAKQISRAQYEGIVSTAIGRFRQASSTKKGGGKKATRIDRRLFFIIDSVAQGRTLYSEAFRLSSTNRHTFFELAERM